MYRNTHMDYKRTLKDSKFEVARFSHDVTRMHVTSEKWRCMLKMAACALYHGS